MSVGDLTERDYGSTVAVGPFKGALARVEHAEKTTLVVLHDGGKSWTLLYEPDMPCEVAP